MIPSLILLSLDISFFREKYDSWLRQKSSKQQLLVVSTAQPQRVVYCVNLSTVSTVWTCLLCLLCELDPPLPMWQWRAPQSFAHSQFTAIRIPKQQVQLKSIFETQLEDKHSGRCACLQIGDAADFYESSKPHKTPRCIWCLVLDCVTRLFGQIWWGSNTHPWFMSCSVSSSHIRTWMVLPSRIQWKMSSILSSLSSSYPNSWSSLSGSRWKMARCWGARCCLQRPTRQPWDPLTTFLSRHPNPPPPPLHPLLPVLACSCPLDLLPHCPLPPAPASCGCSQVELGGRCEGQGSEKLRWEESQLLAADPHWGKTGRRAS